MFASVFTPIERGKRANTTNSTGVWYTKAANKALRGINAPGCYKSPCSNPLDNSKKGCAAKSNDYFQCTWCPKYKGQGT